MLEMIEMIENTNINKILESENKTIVLTDGIHNAFNAATIIRNAGIVGMTDLFICPRIIDYDSIKKCVMNDPTLDTKIQENIQKQIIQFINTIKMNLSSISKANPEKKEIFKKIGDFLDLHNFENCLDFLKSNNDNDIFHKIIDFLTNKDKIIHENSINAVVQSINDNEIKHFKKQSLFMTTLAMNAIKKANAIKVNADADAAVEVSSDMKVNDTTAAAIEVGSEVGSAMKVNAAVEVNATATAVKVGSDMRVNAAVIYENTYFYNSEFISEVAKLSYDLFVSKKPFSNIIYNANSIDIIDMAFEQGYTICLMENYAENSITDNTQHPMTESKILFIVGNEKLGTSAYILNYFNQMKQSYPEKFKYLYIPSTVETSKNTSSHSLNVAEAAILSVYTRTLRTNFTKTNGQNTKVYNVITL